MTEQLEEQLESLSPNDISRFSLAAAETLWLTFKKIYEKEFDGDVAKTDVIFDKAWLLVAGQLKDTTAEELDTMAQDQIPNLDNHMEIFESVWRSTLASSAQNAATAVWMAVSGLAEDPIDTSFEVIDIIRNTLDILISTQLSEEKGNDYMAEEEEIESHALYQDELQRQIEAVRALKSGKSATFRQEFVQLMQLNELGIDN
jgi:hypothetical protein